MLPENALVGLITFGRNVQVHEIGFADIPKSYVFRAKKKKGSETEFEDYTPAQIGTMLGLTTRAAPGAPAAPAMAAKSTSRFLLPVSECEFAFETILDDLQKDPWPRVTGERPVRVTGVALSIATSLLEATYQYNGARVMCFVAGPSTDGPGKTVGLKNTEHIRQYVDISKGKAPHVADGIKYYNSLTDRCVKNNHVVDYFGCSLDQTGLMELEQLIFSTGGLVVLADR